MKKRGIMTAAALLLTAFLIVSCIGGTKEERNVTRVEKLYDGFHQDLLRGTLPKNRSGEMLTRPLDEKLLRDAALSYPSEKSGGFTFDTVSFTDDGSLAFICTEFIDPETGKVDTSVPDFGIVQENDGNWYLYDDIYVSPLVTKERSETRGLENRFRVPQDWTVLAESIVDEFGSGTFYFIDVDVDDMIRHFDSCMADGDFREPHLEPGGKAAPYDESGDVSWTYYDDDGHPIYDVLVWQEIPGIPVLDLTDYGRMKPEYRGF